VVLLGDVLTANNLLSRNATAYWDAVTQPLARTRTPWYTVLGNHDDMPFQWPLEWFGAQGLPAMRHSDLWRNPSNSVAG